jgi:antitoxin MazE
MRARVAKWGNSAAVRLPKALVDEMKLRPGQELEITVRPIAPPRVTLDEMVAEMIRLGPENEPPFEDWSEVEAPWLPYEADDKA